MQAAVAAKLIEVHDAIADYPLVAPDEMEAQHYDEQIGHSQSIILALITEDAQAALDRVVSARFGVVRSEVVRLSAEGKIDSEATERLLAAIRKGGE